MIVNTRKESPIRLFLRLTSALIVSILVFVLTKIIELSTGVRRDRGKVTIAKIRRIKKIYAFKVWINKKLPKLCKYVDFGQRSLKFS